MYIMYNVHLAIPTPHLNSRDLKSSLKKYVEENDILLLNEKQ